MSAIQEIIKLARHYERVTGRYPRFIYMDDEAQQMVIDESLGFLHTKPERKPTKLRTLANMIVMPAHNYPPTTVFVTSEPL